MKVKVRNKMKFINDKILNRLNSPQFVGSFENSDFVYFVFREVAVEVSSYGKAVYSRIARVCKNDNGNFS